MPCMVVTTRSTVGVHETTKLEKRIYAAPALAVDVPVILGKDCMRAVKQAKSNVFLLLPFYLCSICYLLASESKSAIMAFP